MPISSMPLGDEADSSDSDSDCDDLDNLPAYAFHPESDPEGDDCSAAAIDVWYFARALEMRPAPEVRPRPEDEPILTTKPKTPFIGCKACKKWKTYKNTKGGGITSTFRKHLRNNHSAVYQEVCRMLLSQGKLKCSTATAATSESNSSQTRDDVRPHEKFTHEGFLLRLMRWIVADDQVCYCAAEGWNFIDTHAIV
ncbi:hypothetical protein L227DRAFT_285464 [Lentinus tigrinus ALCF2SS1-6]|uniref:BED-type domain-containing protein n=1 Tax=Lentinus tigrinus ALCF2SS1-6 TaxID=1328759 RepID=A0A5C2RYH1_9APHY|nr:hypothetical protein L227DRAFT_285464 [Lentinus tigrinus ALCF2SS1-6]